MDRIMQLLRNLGLVVGTLVQGVAFVLIMAWVFWWLWEEPMWGAIVALVGIALATNSYTQGVPGYGARILLNALTGNQRVIFQGLNLVWLWESITTEIDLKTDLKEVLTETYASLDALMDTKYVYTIKPRHTEEAILLFGEFEIDAVKMEGRALFSMLLSDYYGKHSGTELLDKRKINREVFAEEPGKSLIEEFEETHGVEVTVRLEDSDFDAETQKARDNAAKAEAMATAKKKLVDAGWSPEEAEKRVAQLTVQGIQEFIVDVRGIPNVRDINIIGGSGGKK